MIKYVVWIIKNRPYDIYHAAKDYIMIRALCAVFVFHILDFQSCRPLL